MDRDDPHRPDEGTQALLFDCDGTLVETMHLHRLSWGRIFERYGFTITDEWWDRYANVALAPFVRAAIPDADDALLIELLDEANIDFTASLHLAEPVEHVIDLAREYRGRLPIAVVTGGYRDVIIPTLEGAGIADLFDTIVTADDVVHSKPAPDVYLTAMARLGVEPSRCVAYEDSDIGIASAQAAGVGRVVDVRDWPLDTTG